jgi:ABC-2 type transport system permease protein
MFGHFFWFELKLRARSVSTYIYFLIPFLMTLFGVSAEDFGPIPAGKILVNGPFAIFQMYLDLTAFGAILLAAIFGPAILRDFQQDTYQLLFTKPISKVAYLGGRWAGSFVTAVFVFSGLIFGAMAGSFMPWADRTRLAPIHLWWYLQPFLSVVLVQVFFLGALFFCVAALTRRIVVVYLQGVALFGLYLILVVSVLTANQLIRFWPSVFDPLGIILRDTVTRYWTVAEKNTQLVNWIGIFLYNRLTWIAVGVIALVVVYALFPMSAEVLGARGSSRRAEAARREEEAEKVPRPRFAGAREAVRSFTGMATLEQLGSMTAMRFFNIVRDVPFWAIGLIMVVLVMVNGRFAGDVNGVEVWPVTYLAVQVVSGSSGLFLYIIAVLYAGEVIWRERDVRFDQIHDSLPLRDWTDLVSRFFALVGVEALLVTVVLICGVASQAFNGYYHFELAEYFKELYLVYLPQVVMVVLLALFIHTVVSNKFIGHAIVIGFFVMIPVLYRYGIENRLYLFGEITPYTYSDMNGYGHFAKGLFWSISYWLWIAAFLGVLAIVLARRGVDLSWANRMRLARPRLVKLIPAAALFLAAAGTCGAWFYHNAHTLNEFRTAKETRHRQAEYEQLYKKYQRTPQPKITAVDVAVDIFPERRSFRGSAHFTMVNKSGAAIEEVLVTDAQESLDELRFDRASHVKLHDARHTFWIYELEQPLAPGETMTMDCRVSKEQHGFKDGNERPELAYNGTFFDRDYFPYVGYNANLELDNPARRREEKLGPLEEMAPRGDPYYSNVNLFSPDADWVTFHALVSTSGDQIAIAPGYLKREWTEGGRHHFEYDMGDTKIANFYSFLSARYSVKRDQWKNVKLEIYYQPGHEYNLDKMIESSKSGLDYYEKNFSAFQFDQFRVLEFPRYRQFAQSFPNTVPYSESIGFIERMKKPDDIDLLYFVTAHELAHQWWGHQLIGSMTQGSNMMAESLAEYSALKVMEKKYGQEMLRKSLRYELDRYLRGRGGEVRHEPPLVLVQREPYVWYSKGSLVMFALADYIGEDRVNAALRNFLENNRYAAGPYPDTRGFVAALREVTPPEYQHVITDMFESIVLFDNRAVSATYVETPEHKYRVALQVKGQKRQADGSGNETPMAVDDYMDIGVFSGTKDHLKPLYMQKQHITQENAIFEETVDEKPTFAGIDPYFKLIDRNPEDNVIEVEKKK